MDEGSQQFNQVLFEANTKNCNIIGTAGNNREETGEEKDSDVLKSSANKNNTSNLDPTTIELPNQVDNCSVNTSEILCEGPHHTKIEDLSGCNTKEECGNIVGNKNILEDKVSTNLKSISEKNESLELQNDFRPLINFCVNYTDIKNGDENIISSGKEKFNHTIISNNDKDIGIEGVKDMINEKEGELSTLDVTVNFKNNFSTENLQISNETDVKVNETFLPETSSLREILQDGEEKTEINTCKEINAETKIESKTEFCEKEVSKVDVVLHDTENKYSTYFKNVLSEAEKQTEDKSSKNDSKETNNSQSNSNVSSSVLIKQGNNQNKSENSNAEIIDPEIVNCHEIELIDLNENELEKDKEIDRIGSDANRTEAEAGQLNEEANVDVFETVFEKNEFDHMASVNEKDKFFPNSAEQQDVSDEETITGDTRTQISKSLENVKGKDEHLCIVPDDVSQKLSTIEQNKKLNFNTKKLESEGNEKEVIQIPATDVEKIKLRSEGKKPDMDNAKSRPIRNAAKLAGNKIKSLVLNDSVFEESSASSVSVENSAKSGNSDKSHRLCAQCKEVKLWKYLMVHGNTNQYLCSEQCSESFTKHCENEVVAREKGTTRLSSRVCAQCQTRVILNELSLFWETMDFCNEDCLGKYQIKLGSNCANCKGNVFHSSLGKYCVRFGCDVKQFCSGTCLEEYKKELKVCSYCQKDISTGVEGFLAPVGDKGQFKDFCTQSCMEKYEEMCSVTPKSDLNEDCAVCSNCKPVQIEVQLDNHIHRLCSEPCFAAFKFVNKITEGLCNMCKKYFDRSKTENYSVFYDDALRSFCCKTCMNVYILANRKIVPCTWCKNQYSKQGVEATSKMSEINSPISVGTPRRTSGRRSQVESPCVPVISSIQSLASPKDSAAPLGMFSSADTNAISEPNSQSPAPTTPTLPPQTQVYQQIIMKPPPAKEMKNKSVLCKPYSHTKGVSCRPHPCMKETQTDQSLCKKFLIPIPVPIYVPAPMHMFATPFPVPVPFPLPVPVPIFIPTTRNSAKGIFKEIKKIQEKIPTDPFEAELLMMAEMVAGDKKQDPTDSESEDGNDGDDADNGGYSPENVDTSNAFGDDMLQMALKMASELEEPPVDMESVLTSNTITTSTQPPVDPNKALYDQVQVMSMSRGRKRSSRGSRNSTGGTPNKRGRRTSGSVDVPLLPPPEPVPPPRIEIEKPDADLCLKYTFGVNAWRHWVMQKNAELEKVAMTNRKIKLFKPELLQLTADELNFSLCLFVKEVRKPNGTEYAPDTIYYLCLGIQQYLFENGRIDNIFTDSYYEKFTDCLDEVAKKFAALYNDSQYIVTRVEEEHLWESKQLGAHSPHVLLSTLMFFNTKHFNLVTVEEHMQLSFSHIMKHWKRNPNSPGVAKVPGSRNVLLRFYPPQSALEANSRKKKVYEQQENEENPLRCPVKLYEFYLSKCPESVKTRNDVFYLLPERSCVPDSPVWYSTMALGKEPLMKMLHRVKMVKEINIALLSC